MSTDNFDHNQLFRQLDDFTSRVENHMRARSPSKATEEVATTDRFRSRFNRFYFTRTRSPPVIARSDMEVQIKSSNDGLLFLNKSRLRKARDSQFVMREKQLAKASSVEMERTITYNQPKHIGHVHPPRKSSLAARQFVEQSREMTIVEMPTAAVEQQYVHHTSMTDDIPSPPILLGPRHESLGAPSRTSDSTMTISATPPRTPDRSSTVSTKSFQPRATVPRPLGIVTMPPTDPRSSTSSINFSSPTSSPTWSTSRSSSEFCAEIEKMILKSERLVSGEQRRSKKLAAMLSVGVASPPPPQEPKPEVVEEEEGGGGKEESRTKSPPESGQTKGVRDRDNSTDTKSSLHRTRSVFGWLQKRSEVDDLIDLYMTDGVVEVSKKQQEIKRKPVGSAPRLGRFRSTRNLI